MSDLEVVGNLKNVAVLVDHEARSVILGTTPPIKFSVDHPYIQGTKLEQDARAALDRGSVVLKDEKSASS